MHFFNEAKIFLLLVLKGHSDNAFGTYRFARTNVGSKLVSSRQLGLPEASRTSPRHPALAAFLLHFHIHPFPPPAVFWAPQAPGTSRGSTLEGGNRQKGPLLPGSNAKGTNLLSSVCVQTTAINDDRKLRLSSPPPPEPYSWYPGAMSRLDPTGTSSLSGQSQGPAVAMGLGQL